MILIFQKYADVWGEGDMIRTHADKGEGGDEQKFANVLNGWPLIIYVKEFHFFILSVEHKQQNKGRCVNIKYNYSQSFSLKVKFVQ